MCLHALTLCVSLCPENMFVGGLPGISANSNKNYRRYNFQTVGNIAGNFRKIVCLYVCPSVCLSDTRVDCDKSKWCTTDIFIPHERAITLLGGLLWHQQWSFSPSSQFLVENHKPFFPTCFTSSLEQTSCFATSALS